MARSRLNVLLVILNIKAKNTASRRFILRCYFHQLNPNVKRRLADVRKKGSITWPAGLWIIQQLRSGISCRWLFYHISVILPYIRYSTIYQIFYHIPVILPSISYSTIYQVFYHISVTLPYISYSTIYQLFYHQSVILPSISYSTIYQLFFHISVILPPISYSTI